MLEGSRVMSNPTVSLEKLLRSLMVVAQMLLHLLQDDRRVKSPWGARKGSPEVRVLCGCSNWISYLI